MVQVTPVQCRANDYVHTSGVAFVRISNPEEEEDPFTIGQPSSEMDQPASSTWGFYWMHNYMLTRRWRSAATGDSGAGSTLRGELEDFCSDKNGALKTFWESCKEAAEKAARKGMKEENKPEAKKNDETGSELNRDVGSGDLLDVEGAESSTMPSNNLPATREDPESVID